jgi:hypothetical protein
MPSVLRYKHHAQILKRIVSLVPVLVVNTIAFGNISKGLDPHGDMQAHTLALIST